MDPLPPPGKLPSANEKNLRRARRWDDSGNVTRILLAIVWILKMFIVFFLAICFVLAGAVILAPIPFLLGLKFFAEPPFGIRKRT